MEETLALDPDEQLAIFEELALVRSYAVQFVRLYSLACEKHDADPTDKNLEIVFSAGQAMSGVLAQVSEMADKAQKIAAKQKERFNIHDMYHVVDAIVVLVHEACGTENKHIAEALAQKISTQLKLPSGHGEAADKGTSTRSSDEVAKDFDDSIPREPEENV